MIRKTISILETTPECYRHFSCGKTELDEYLKRYAKGNHKKGIGKTFVLQENSVVVGFYTISMGAIEFSSIPENKKHSLPRYPIPIARIGRLGVDNSFKGTGTGKFLLVDALHRIYEASLSIAAFAVVVDARDETSKKFYMHFGFLECQDSQLSLFLPMETIQKLFQKK